MGLWHPFRDNKREALARQPFPDAWSAIIARNVPYFKELHAVERTHLEDLIKVFIAEKHFEGCGGLAMTDAIKVTIAAQACLLLLNLHHDYFERLVSILVYPQSFDFEQEERGEVGTVTLTNRPVSGLCSSSGAIVLSWPDTSDGAQRPDDGVNVVFHEFAHQLDLLDSAMDGAPVLDSRSLYREWARVLGAEFSKLQRDVAQGLPSLISAYGATKPAEFFAVVTELFFEKPAELQREHPELYAEFRQYYRQDPVQRFRKV